ncbi:WYL domain-containing protein [Kitasatospora sp. NPDC056076]|uniref:WYL domain-containing protein n=1 Tax=Kitasatospora sp. NPDC056076 TaxID=3345703 RepID=UPI0035D68F22
MMPHTAVTPRRSQMGEKRRLALLTVATERQRPVTITYQCYKDRPEIEVRTVEIHSVSLTKDGNTVLSAYCHVREDMRTFRLDRILAHRVSRRRWRGPQPPVTAYFSMRRARNTTRMVDAPARRFTAESLLAGIREKIAAAAGRRVLVGA